MSLGLGIAFTQKADEVHNIAVIPAVDPVTAEKKIPGELQNLLAASAEQITTNDGRSYYELRLTDAKLGNTVFHFWQTGWEQAMVRLKRGNLGLVLEADDGRIRYHFDPINPEAQLAYLKLSALLAGDVHELRTRENTVEPLTVTGTRYIDFLIPGLIAMGIMMSCLWGISYGIIEKRTKKLLRRMVATPMKKSHFLIAKITVRMVMNFTESALLFLFAWLVFDISIQGGLIALLLVFIAGNLAFAGISIFTSSRTANTEIGNGLINVVVLPMMVLSGIFFSYHNFPDWSIPYIRLLPLTMLADATRSIFIEGAGLNEVALPVTILSTIGVVFFAAGLKVFKWH
jgi:ABC-type multidrug transport system permease subunit